MANLIVVEKFNMPLAGSHFYKYGLSLFPTGSVPRKRFYHPVLIFVFITIYWIKLVICLAYDFQDDDFNIWIGNFVYFMDGRVHTNFNNLIYGSMAIVFQTIHCWYYWTGIEPTYLRPLLMSAGKLSPETLGLTDKETVRKLRRRVKLNIWLAGMVLKSGIPLAILIAGIPFAMNVTPLQFIFLSLPWTVVFTIWIHYTGAFFLYQVGYFLSICYYFKLKIKHLNEELVRLTRPSKKIIRSAEIKRIVRQFDAVHREVFDYNDNYWSLYLFVLIIHVILIINLLMFGIAFGNINFYIKILFVYIVILFSMSLSLLLTFPSSIARQFTKSFELLNNLYAGRVIKNKLIKIKIKVNSIIETNWIIMAF